MIRVIKSLRDGPEIPRGWEGGMPQFEVLSFDMGIHGWIALVIAVVGIAGLHFGLMWLARKPHDDRFHPDEQPGDDPADRAHHGTRHYGGGGRR